MSNSNKHSSKAKIIIVQGLWQSEKPWWMFEVEAFCCFLILFLQMQLPAGNKGSRDSMWVWRGAQQPCLAREREGAARASDPPPGPPTNTKIHPKIHHPCFVHRLNRNRNPFQNPPQIHVKIHHMHLPQFKVNIIHDKPCQKSHHEIHPTIHHEIHHVMHHTCHHPEAVKLNNDGSLNTTWVH